MSCNFAGHFYLWTYHRYIKFLKLSAAVFQPIAVRHSRAICFLH